MRGKIVRFYFHRKAAEAAEDRKARGYRMRNEFRAPIWRTSRPFATFAALRLQTAASVAHPQSQSDSR